MNPQIVQNILQDSGYQITAFMQNVGPNIPDEQIASVYQVTNNAGHNCVAFAYELEKQLGIPEVEKTLPEDIRLRQTHGRAEICYENLDDLLDGGQEFSVPNRMMYNTGSQTHGEYPVHVCVGIGDSLSYRFRLPNVVSFQLENLPHFITSLIAALQNLHERNIIHGAVNMDNIFYCNDQNGPYRFQLNNFVYSQKYLHADESHISNSFAPEYHPVSKNELIFGSGYTHTTRKSGRKILSTKRRNLSRREDLKSFMYVLLKVASVGQQNLPWEETVEQSDLEHGNEQAIKTRTNALSARVGRMKDNATGNSIFGDLSEEFAYAYDYITNLGFQEAPNYNLLWNLLQHGSAELLEQANVDSDD